MVKLPRTFFLFEPSLNCVKFFNFLIVCVCLSALLTRHHFIPTTDISWLTIAAERLLAGQKFDEHIYELNTPFAVLIYTLPVWIGSWLPVSSFFVTYALTTLLAFTSIHFASKILVYRGYKNFQNNAAHIAIFKLSFLCAYLFFPGLNGFAQRDHIIAMLMLPYCLIKLSSCGFKEHADERPYLINMVSLLAMAAVLFIKPQYLINVCFINLLSLLWRKKITFYTPGLYILFFAPALAVYSVLTFFPEWIALAQKARDAYAGYRQELGAVAQYFIHIIFIPLAFIFLLEKPRIEAQDKQSDFLISLLLIAVAAVPLFFLSRNGWYYHAVTFTLPLWGLCLYLLFTGLSQKAFYQFSAVLAGILIINYGFLHYQDKTLREQILPPINHSSIKAGDSFLCISPDIQCAFPFVTLYQYKYASRYPALWPTAGAKKLHAQGFIKQDILSEFTRQDISNMIIDIHHNKPSIIVIQWSKDASGNIDDFSHHKEFSRLLNQYKLIQRIDRSEHFATWIFIQNKNF